MNTMILILTVVPFVLSTIAGVMVDELEMANKQ